MATSVQEEDELAFLHLAKEQISNQSGDDSVSSVEIDAISLQEKQKETEPEKGKSNFSKFGQKLSVLTKKSNAIAANVVKDTKQMWNKTTHQIKRKVVTEETEEVLKETFEIYKVMLKDLGFRPVDISLAVSALCVYHKGQYVKSGKSVKTPQTVKTLQHYMRFASAAYGWKLLYGYVKKSRDGILDGIKKKDEASIDALLKHTGIKAEDILQTRFTSANIYAPGHYIALDHSTKSLILAIRGTFHLRDAITDLMATMVPFKGGSAHSGMIYAATAKGAELLPYIKEVMSKYPEHKLVVVGHSLGAGTASLLSMMLHEDHGIPLHCYAFASPCVVSEELANKCKDYITTLVINDDIVPRLSLGAVNDLKSCVKQLLAQKDQKLKMLFQIMSAGNQLGESTTQKISNYLDCNAKIQFEKVEKEPRLYPPGLVYYIYTDVMGSDKYDLMEESTPKHYEDIVVSYSMYIDHFPNTYEDALERTLRRFDNVELTEISKPIIEMEERD